MYSKAMKRVIQPDGVLPLLDVGGDRADPGVGEVAGHPAQGIALEDHVGVDDQHGLGPVVVEDPLVARR